MSNNQLAGFPAFGPRVDSTITYNVKTITYDPAIELPTSNPASPQVSLQITSADLPSGACLTWDAADTFSVKYKSYIYVKVDNLSGNYATLYGSVATGASSYGSAVSASSVWNNGNAVLFANSVSGYDALDAYNYVKLYANAAGCYLTKAWLVMVPNRMRLAGIGKGYKDLEIDLSTTSWIGASATGSSRDWNFSPYENLQIAKTASFTVQAGTIGPSGTTIYGLGNAAVKTAAWDKSTTSAYYNWQPYYPTRIAYTPIL